MSREIHVIRELVIEQLPEAVTTHCRLPMMRDGMGQWIELPIIVLRGAKPGPILGVTAAVHGNELNGISVVHRLLKTLDPAAMAGTLVAVPVVNVPGYNNFTRSFNDGADLNRIMPGKASGTSAQQYCHRFLDTVLRRFEYHIDLHTASFGRINSLYVRADLGHPTTAWMARLQNAEILVHNCGADGTFRAAAAGQGIPSITVEVGNPQRFQKQMIGHGVTGLRNVMVRLEMIEDEISEPANDPVLCVRSYWIYTDHGGVLDVIGGLADPVEKGELIGRVWNIYGELEAEYFAPEHGCIVGKSSNPVNQAGSRILHLGIPGDESEMQSCPLPEQRS